MVVYEIASNRKGERALQRPLDLIVFALVVLNASYVVVSYFFGTWLLAPDGTGIPTDFVNVWAAGKLVLQGNPAAAYDWPVHKAVEVMALGRPFQGYFGWHYPPPFLFVAAGLALLPYAVASAAWSLATLPLYLAAGRAIIGERVGYALAAAFPAVLPNFIVGQNGFLTAALIGGALVTLTKRPIMAGVFIGLLTFKPHLGLLFPVVLVVCGYWRAFVVAGVITAVMALVSLAAFGPDTWQAFYANIGHTSQAFLSEGQANFGKLQTIFGVTRVLGGSEPLAWTLQAIVILACAVSVGLLWRSRADYEIKAAALACGILLATPYLYLYDLVVLAIPLAFLFRLARARGLLPYELAGIGLCCLLVLIFPLVTVPVGFAAVLVAAALVARRALAPQPAPLKVAT